MLKYWNRKLFRTSVTYVLLVVYKNTIDRCPTPRFWFRKKRFWFWWKVLMEEFVPYQISKNIVTNTLELSNNKRWEIGKEFSRQTNIDSKKLYRKTKKLCLICHDWASSFKLNLNIFMINKWDGCESLKEH